MSKSKQGGKTRQHTTRPGKRLGLKVFGGEKVKTGMIIVRQKGTKFHPGTGVDLGRDHTIFSLRNGIVSYSKKQGRRYVHVTDPANKKTLKN